MISKNKFKLFTILAILLILNTIYLYPWSLQWSLFESSWIVIGTIGAIVSYYIALMSNYAPFQTFVMRIIFWAYAIMFFLSVMRRTFEFLSSGIPQFAIFNTIFYLLIVIVISSEGYSLYNSYGKNRYMKQKYNSDIDSIIHNEGNKSQIRSSKNNLKKGPLKNTKKENLTLIEGVGPIIQDVLYQNKITTFKQLSNTPAYKIKEILDQNNLHAHSPKTWPKQAVLAHQNKWDDLRKWQEELMGGREEK